MILNPRIGVCYTLNSVGLEIWEGLINGEDISAIAVRICEKYDQDISIVEQDILDLLEQLKSEGLVV